MAERKSLVAGLAVVPEADPEAVRSFITQEPKQAKTPAEPQSVPPTDQKKKEKSESKPRKPIRSKTGPIHVAMIPVTVRLKPEIASALKRASLERQLHGETPSTQQEIVELALDPWLKTNGYLS